MPLEDGYATEKELNQHAGEIAKAITEFLKDVEKEKTRGFVFFLFDFPTGTLQYYSDMKKEDVVPMMKFWVTRNEQ